ncbi:MAG: tRNA pseudouridine(55) synthase TruB [Actinomycetota bacterium]|jgi:tRNA pseudouridine55 synthase
MARKPAVTHGFVVVDKPAGMTSHDVVSRIRRRFNERRVGHSGTLDPDATGALIVAVGNATRLLQFFGDLPKTYTGEVVFGAATTTLDASGDVTATRDMSSLTIERVREAARGFVGDIMQVPPMVSAIKIGGRRLHEIAREGGEVERQPRPVTVNRFDVVDEVDHVAGNPVVRVEVSCSSGTYIRTLAADLGTALGGVAHLRNLRRRAIGDFVVGASPDPSSIDTSPLMPVVAALARVDGSGVAFASVDDETAPKVGNGRVLATLGELPGADGQHRFVLDSQHRLLAVYEYSGDAWRPVVVMPAALA